jgi:transposase
MLSLLNCTCGLDVHKDMIQACILKGEGATPDIVRAEFATKQAGLESLCAWIDALACDSIALESTGVYWMPVYETIERLYPEKDVIVVNAQHMHNLPGRKSDVKDAEWIARMLRYGLLEASFVPDRHVRDMRKVSRFKRAATNERTASVNRLEKFLQMEGFKLSSVVSNILGASGRALLDTLALKGKLAFSDVESSIRGNLKASSDEIHLAIKGRLDGLGRRMLRMLLDKIDYLDAEIAEFSHMLWELAAQDRVQVEMLDSIPGIDIDAALAILAEISPTPQAYFANSGRLCSWAGLTPRNDESAGKLKCNRILHGNPYVKSILCQAAWSAVYTRKSSFCDWYWKNQARMGRKKAIIAVARKMLSLCYKLLQSGEFYDPVMAQGAMSLPG